MITKTQIKAAIAIQLLLIVLVPIYFKSLNDRNKNSEISVLVSTNVTPSTITEVKSNTVKQIGPLLFGGTTPISDTNGLKALGVANGSLAADAVTSDKIQNGTIVHADIADNSIGVQKLFPVPVYVHGTLAISNNYMHTTQSGVLVFLNLYYTGLSGNDTYQLLIGDSLPVTPVIINWDASSGIGNQQMTFFVPLSNYWVYIKTAGGAGEVTGSYHVINIH